MQVPFRQGLIRHQIDANSSPSFLQKVSGGQYIDLVVSPTPTVMCFAHGTETYLFEETNTIAHAWGPFTTPVDQWLYWDIDLLTGVRTFGATHLNPVVAPTQPPNPQNDQHWFNTTNTTMFVWNSSRWVEKVRLFAAKYDNSSFIIPQIPGTQVGLSVVSTAGFILFDDDEKPIKKWKRDNNGKFLTTESPILTHASRVSNVVLDGVTQTVRACQNIPQWSVVTFDDYNDVMVASYLNQSRPAAGITKWNMVTGDVGIIHTGGYITNNNWNWTAPAATSLFVGVSGQITTEVPQIGSIQRIGMIVDTDTIFVDIGMHIILIHS